MRSRNITVAFASDDRIVAGGLIEELETTEHGLMGAIRRWINKVVESQSQAAATLGA
jgi:hypothetical protein